MTTTARRIASWKAHAAQSTAQSDAYQALAELLATDPRFAAIAEVEVDRARRCADEFLADALENANAAAALEAPEPEAPCDHVGTGRRTLVPASFSAPTIRICAGCDARVAR